MKNPKKWKNSKANSSGVGAGYMLGLIGAAVYYISIAHGFGSSLVGFLKALVWPAFLVYHLLGLK